MKKYDNDMITDAIRKDRTGEKPFRIPGKNKKTLTKKEYAECFKCPNCHQRSVDEMIQETFAPTKRYGHTSKDEYFCLNCGASWWEHVRPPEGEEEDIYSDDVVVSYSYLEVPHPHTKKAKK